MTVAGRPLTAVLAVGGFVCAALYSLFFGATIAVALLLISVIATVLFAVAALAWIYMLVRTAWRLWRGDPRVLALARIMAWLLVGVAILSVLGSSRNLAGFAALAVAVMVDVCLYLPATTREYQPLLPLEDV
jgi:hypothetical protein